MLPRSERLRLKVDFAGLRQKGQRLNRRHVSLVFCPDDDYRKLVGFIVSKRVSPKAVIRNRVKRRLRAAYNEARQWAPAKYNYLIIARPEAASANYTELEKEVLSLFKRVLNS